MIDWKWGDLDVGINIMLNYNLVYDKNRLIVNRNNFYCFLLIILV